MPWLHFTADHPAHDGPVTTWHRAGAVKLVSDAVAKEAKDKHRAKDAKQSEIAAARAANKAAVLTDDQRQHQAEPAAEKPADA